MRFLTFIVLLFLPLAEVTAQTADPVVANAVAYLRTRQNSDGSFGSTTQPRLQTSLAMLALMAASAPLSAADLKRVTEATAYLERNAATGGGLGDPVYSTESHAVATLALLCSLDHLQDAAVRENVCKRLTRALQWLERMQDRGSSAQTQGGWKQEQGETKTCDRRTTAWALLALHTAKATGLPVKDAALKRATLFLLAAGKPADAPAEQAGGFSVDADGLAVEAISAMGGWSLARYLPEDKRTGLAVQWLARHPPLWAGPNYFYANFFRTRALGMADSTGKESGRARQRLAVQIRDNQQSDGSVAFPPGEAQNFVDMGPVFSSAFAVLILRAGDSPLLFDLRTRMSPLF